MFFLQKFNDEITVSTLPHPISMFLLGFTIFTVLALFVEYRRTKADMKELQQSIRDLEKQLRTCVDEADKKLAEVSRKVDSRVDKAIVALKKSTK